MRSCIPFFCLLITASAYSSKSPDRASVARCLTMEPMWGKTIVSLRVGTRAFEDYQLKYLAARIMENETLSPEIAHQKAKQIIVGRPYQQYPLDDTQYQDPEYNNTVALGDLVTYGAHEEQSLKVLMSAYYKQKPALPKADSIDKK